MSQHRLNLNRQIAQTEEAIAEGNARRHLLWSDLKKSAKGAVKHRGKSLAIVAVGAIVAAVLLFPKRRQISSGAQKWLNHPLADWVMIRLPYIGALLPFVRTAQAMARGGPMGIISSLGPWLMRAFTKPSDSSAYSEQYGPPKPAQAPTAHTG